MLSLLKPGHEKQMQQTGQASVEVIVIAIILVGLLFFVLLTTYSRNMQTMQLQEISSESIQCREMSAVISRLYSSRANASETIFLETETRLQKPSAKQGNMDIGASSCSYVCTVKKGSEYDSDSGGITLSVGTWCFEKQGEGVEAIEGECS